jgi:hypothetical protein
VGEVVVVVGGGVTIWLNGGGFGSLLLILSIDDRPDLLLLYIPTIVGDAGIGTRKPSIDAIDSMARTTIQRVSSVHCVDRFILLCELRKGNHSTISIVNIRAYLYRYVFLIRMMMMLTQGSAVMVDA